VRDFEYSEYEKKGKENNMENVMQLVVESGESPAEVVVKKETYQKSELGQLREDIAHYVRDIKAAKAEARLLKGNERHAKKLFAKNLGEKVRWRYLCYAILRGKDITNVEHTWRDLWCRRPDVANAILFYIPKDQYQFWGMKEIERRLNEPYVRVLVKDQVVWYPIGKEKP